MSNNKHNFKMKYNVDNMTMLLTLLREFLTVRSDDSLILPTNFKEEKYRKSTLKFTSYLLFYLRH